MRHRLTHGYAQITYAGWPEEDHPWIQRLPEQLGARRFRLLLSAWCRDLTVPWLDKALPDKRLREDVKGTYLAALEVSDRFADTGKSKTALKEARRATFFRGISATHGVSSMYDTLLSEDSVVGTLDRCAMVATFRDKVPVEELVPLLRRYLSDLTVPEGHAGRVDVSCLDSNVLSLARAIYQERAFERMGVLADALEVAGCDDAAILEYCRAADRGHNRGCWVLDLVLAQE
jgi:hypothetical protein